ncbi:MAG: hypothetical protein JKY67_17995, partial [Pseudomonadales bacterium]|nr:hypothetical protein [Pseudomonadales bacterium]
SPVTAAVTVARTKLFLALTGNSDVAVDTVTVTGDNDGNGDGGRQQFIAATMAAVTPPS